MESLLWAREDAKESWAKSQSYNLYRKINSIYRKRQATDYAESFLCSLWLVLLAWDLSDKTRVSVILAGVVEPDQIFFERVELCLADAGADLAEDFFL